MNTLYDANTFVGHWPFRQVVNSTPRELRALLESYGIKKALTANMNSIFYKDAHSGNRELAEMIDGDRDFFVGAAILNPTYAVWERDLESCVRDFGFKALRLVPQYHDYKIGDQNCLAVCNKAVELDIPVLISSSMVDPRQAHWMDTNESISLNQVLELAEKVEKLKIVCSGFYCAPDDADRLSKAEYCNRVYFDTSRFLRSAFYQHFAYVVKKLGAGQFMYGSNAPLRGVRSSLLALDSADLPAPDKEIVAVKTFDKMFQTKS